MAASPLVGLPRELLVQVLSHVDGRTLSAASAVRHLRGLVHPAVLFSIVDHYSRRDEEQNRVIGTLLGMAEKLPRDCPKTHRH